MSRVVVPEGYVRAWCSRHQKIEQWTKEEAREHWKNAIHIPAGTPSMSFEDLAKTPGVRPYSEVNP